MDELELLRELDDIPRPDRSRLAPGRQRLLDAAARGGKVRRLRTDWRFATAGAVTAVAVAAVVAAQLAPCTGKNAPGGELGAGSTAGTPAEILDAQADALENEQLSVPKAGQWVYTRSKSYSYQDGERSSDPILTPMAKLKQGGGRPGEEWAPYAVPALENGTSGDDYSPRKIYQILASMPDDIDGVLAKARVAYPAAKTKAEGGPETQLHHDFRALNVLAESYPVDPTGMAQVYRAMATIKGIKAAPTKDLAGRPVIAFSLSKPDSNDVGIADEYLLDPKTHLFTGRRSIALTDGPPPPPKGFPAPSSEDEHYKKGDVLLADTVVQEALVSARGVRP